MEDDNFNRLSKDTILVVLSNMDAETLYNTCILNSRVHTICNKNAIQIFKPRFDKEYPGFDINSVKPENLRIVYKAFADGLKKNGGMPHIDWNFTSFDDIKIEHDIWEYYNIKDAYLEDIVTLYTPFDKNKSHEIYIVWNPYETMLPDMLFKIKRDRPIALIDILEDISKSDSEAIIFETMQYNGEILQLLPHEEDYSLDMKSGEFSLQDFIPVDYSNSTLPDDGIPKYWIHTSTIL